MEEMTTTLVHKMRARRTPKSRAAENEAHVTVGKQTVSEALSYVGIETELTNTQDSMSRFSERKHPSP